MCFIQPWFGVIMGKTQAPETHKHMNQQELARQVIIKQPSATCKYPLQFWKHNTPFFLTDIKGILGGVTLATMNLNRRNIHRETRSRSTQRDGAHLLSKEEKKKVDKEDERLEKFILYMLKVLYV